MSGGGDWEWKLREAVERLRTRYEHIGRKTGAPFLAIVYPPEVERIPAQGVAHPHRNTGAGVLHPDGRCARRDDACGPTVRRGVDR